MDIVITIEIETQIKDMRVDHVNFSDQAFIFIKLTFEFKRSPEKSVSIKVYKDINLKKLKTEISSKLYI